MISDFQPVFPVPMVCAQGSTSQQTTAWQYIHLLQDFSPDQGPSERLFTSNFTSPAQLPREPEALAAAVSAKEAAAEASRKAQQALDVEAVRTLRMELRNILTGFLARKRYSLFAVPPHPNDEPDFWQKVRGPKSPLYQYTSESKVSVGSGLYTL